MSLVPAITFKLQLELPNHFLDDVSERSAFILLAAFLASFLFIRTSARLIRSPKVSWWPGSVKTSGGLHLHHLVWGIVLLLLCGFLGFAVHPHSPATEILAALFGVGAGLTLDEFALWVHLRDVYWSEEGRSSFDAVIVAAVIGGLIVVGAAPFGLPDNTSSIDTLVVAVLSDVVLAAVAILKGKPLLGVIGIFIPPVSFIAAIRLASPHSPWARRFYASNQRKLARAQRRWTRIEARRRRIQELIAGAPQGDELDPPTSEPEVRSP